MKRLLVATIASLLPMAMMAQTTHLKFNQDGEFASISEPTGPGSAFSLSVSRNTTNTGTTASISYSSSSVTTDPVTGDTILNFVTIEGAFNASDFTGNINNLALSFSTVDLDPLNSFTESCTLDLSTLNFTCGAVPAGTINVAFRENDAASTTVVLHQETILGNMTTRVNQRSDNSSATASGTVFGTSVVGGGASVGMNHSSTREIIVQ